MMMFTSPSNSRPTKPKLLDQVRQRFRTRQYRQAIEPYRVGVIIGSGIGGIETLETQLENSKIYAPRPGLVVYHAERSFRSTSSPIDVGAQVFRNRTIMKLPATCVIA